jgi:CDP-4-dehydro-6-deoxyglucose reductase
MSQLLSLARAAQLVGLARGALQKLVRTGELKAFDGQITVDELRRVFPTAVLEDAGAFEKVTQIRETAFGQRVRERMLPSQEVLAQRLFAQSQELADLRRYLNAYHALVVEGERRVRELADARGDAQLRALAAEMQAGLKRALGTEPAEALDAMANLLNVISAQVTVKPSGHQFLLEGNDSILQAGLKAGMRFAYGCGSGTCGLCKARVVSGEVRQIEHSDYPLSEAEKRQGYALLCTCTAVTDVVVETIEARGPADIPAQELVATVRAIESLAPDTLLLHLQTPRSNRLRFLAGQSVTLGLPSEQGDLTHSIALASCPCDERNLHFHFARDAGSPLAQALFEGRIRPGAAISVRGPSGDFVLDPDSTRPLVLVACDTGFGPIKSLIEHALAGQSTEAFDLTWVATRGDGHYLANQCRAWAAAFDQFAFRLLADPSAAAGAWQAIEAVVASKRELAQCDVYVAGASEFVEPVLEGLRGAGALPGRMHGLVT